MKTRVILVFELSCFCIVGCKKTSAPSTETNPQPPANDKTAYQSKSSTEWISALKSPNPNTRLKAIRSLYRSCFYGSPQRHKYAKNRDMITAIRQALMDPAEEIRTWADSTLKILPHKDVLTVDELIEVLKQEETVPDTRLLQEKRCNFKVLLVSTDVAMVFKEGDPSFGDSVYFVARFEAAQYLGIKAGREAIGAVPLLKQLRNDKDPAVRFHSAVALWKLLPNSSSPVPLLEKSMEDKDREVRYWAAHALVEAIGADAKVAVPVLLDYIDNTDKPYYGGDAFVKLLKFGPEIMPALLQRLELPGDIWDNAADAVVDDLCCNLGDDLAVEYVIEGLKDWRPAVRLKALEILEPFSTSGEKAFPVLLEMLEDEDLEVRLRALRVLHRTSSDHKEVPALIKAMKDREPRIRVTAAWALGHCLASGAEEAAPSLLEALNDQVPSVRHQAEDILAYALVFGKTEISAVVVPILIKMLKNKDAVLRKTSEELLEYIGPNAKAAIPALTAALKDKNEVVRKTATETLRRISREDVPIVPLAKKPPSPFLANETLSLLACTDLVVLAEQTKGLDPYLEFLRVLKGSKTLRYQTVTEIDGMEKMLPGKGARWILFLREAEDNNDNKIKLFPVTPTGWFISAGSIRSVHSAVPLPEHWGKIESGARMGLRLRKAQFEIGEDIPVEICIHNVEYRASINAVRVFYQHRLDMYDYYPYTRFVVKGPGGKCWELTKPVVETTEPDFTSTQDVSINGTYIHTVRLNKWSIVREPIKGGEEFSIFTPGKYKITCIYSVEKNPPYENPERSNLATWSGTLVSNTVEFVILPRKGIIFKQQLTGLKPYDG